MWHDLFVSGRRARRLHSRRMPVFSSVMYSRPLHVRRFVRYMWLDSFGCDGRARGPHSRRMPVFSSVTCETTHSLHVTLLIRVWRESSCAALAASACILIRYMCDNSSVTCDTTHSWVAGDLVGCTCGECLYSHLLHVRRLIRYMQLDTTHSLLVTWLIRDMTHSCMTGELVCCTCGKYLYSHLLNVTRLIREWQSDRTAQLPVFMCDMIHTWDITHSYMLHELIKYVTRLIREWQESSVTCIPMCDMTHTCDKIHYVWRDLIICVTRLNHMLYVS